MAWSCARSHIIAALRSPAAPRAARRHLPRGLSRGTGRARQHPSLFRRAGVCRCAGILRRARIFCGAGILGRAGVFRGAGVCRCMRSFPCAGVCSRTRIRSGSSEHGHGLRGRDALRCRLHGGRHAECGAQDGGGEQRDRCLTGVARFHGRILSVNGGDRGRFRWSQHLVVGRGRILTPACTVGRRPTAQPRCSVSISGHETFPVRVWQAPTSWDSTLSMRTRSASFARTSWSLHSARRLASIGEGADGLALRLAVHVT